jgi:20S proteasome subunit alpha 3
LFVPTREAYKLYKMDDHVMASVSGVVADANYLIDYGRLHSQRHLYSKRTPIQVEQLVQFLANQKHSVTQYGGSRPFGVSFMYAGFDKMQGFQLYSSDPSGNYVAWKAHATGKNSVQATSTLKDKYKENCTIQEALVLAVEILGKGFDAGKKNANRYEIGVMTREGKLVCQKTLSEKEIEPIIAAADFDIDE